MKRVLIITATAAAACAAAFPAFAGLSGNPSFSHRLPVHVPSQARIVHFDDHGKAVSEQRSGESPSDVPSAVPTSHVSGSGTSDDHGGTTRHAEPGDDRGGARGTSAEPGDDNGTATEPGDDNGQGSATEPGADNGQGSATEPGDDNGPDGTSGDDGRTATPAPSTSSDDSGHGGDDGGHGGSGAGHG